MTPPQEPAGNGPGNRRPARRISEYEPEAQTRGPGRQDGGGLLVAEARRAADGFRCVAVGEVERVDVGAKTESIREADRLLGANIEYPDVVLAIGIHRLGVS